MKSEDKYKDLSKTLDKSVKKQLTLILPFNDAKYQSCLKITSHFISVQDEFIKNDLLFYSGALKAIDSIKEIGLNVDVKLINFDKEDANLDAILNDDSFVK